MTNGIERNKAERVPSLDSRRFSRMNSTVLSRSSIHVRSNSNATSANRRISTIYDSKPSICGGVHKRSTFFRKQGELNSANSSPSIQYDLLRFVKSWFIKSHGSHELATWHLRAFAVTLRKLRKINIWHWDEFLKNGLDKRFDSYLYFFPGNFNHHDKYCLNHILGITNPLSVVPTSQYTSV